MPRELNNRHVAVYGKLMDAKELDDMVSRGITIGVENYCGSQKIAIVSRIVEAPLSAP